MAFSKKEGAESRAIAKPKTKTNNWEPSSLRWILAARKSRRRPQFRPHHLRIRARRRLRSALQRFFVVRQEVLRFVIAAVDDALHFLVNLDRGVFGIVGMLRDLAAQEDGLVLLSVCQGTQLAHD